MVCPASWQRARYCGVLGWIAARRCQAPASSGWRWRQAADRAWSATHRRSRAADRKNTCTRRGRSRAAPSPHGCGNDLRSHRPAPMTRIRAAQAARPWRRSRTTPGSCRPRPSRVRRPAERARSGQRPVFADAERQCGRPLALALLIAVKLAMPTARRHPKAGNVRPVRSASARLHLGPGVAQADRAIEDQLAGLGVRSRQK